MATDLDTWITATAKALDPNLADDLAQEARISRWREYPDHNEHAVKRFLRHRMLARLTGKQGWTGQDRPRRFGRATEYATERLTLPPAPDPAEWIEARVDVHRAMQRLTPNERRFIYLRYWLGMSWTEVERVYGYGPNSVWRSARDKLRRELSLDVV